MLKAELKGVGELKESLGRIGESLITEEPLAAASGKAKELILTRTAEGVDGNKEVFTTYSNTYKRVKEKMGKAAGTVDLRSSGRMLDDLVFEVNIETNESTLCFKEAESQEKAYRRQVSGTGKDMTRREFFFLNEDEKSALCETYSAYIDKVLNENP